MRRLCLLFLLVAPLAWVQVSWAQEPYPLSDEDKKIVEMSRSILQSAVDGASEFIEPFAPVEQPVSLKHSDEWLIFASSSLGDSSLKQLFKEASATGAIVLFRGIPEGKTLGAAIRDWHMLMTGLDPVPQVRIDPKAFVHWRVTSVPAIFRIEDDKVTASALGVYSKDWLQRQIETGNTGSLGQRGPIHSILEPDLMQVAMQRLQSIDLGALKKKAIERFWSRQTFTELPKATQYRIRMVDPTIVMKRPLLDANGRTLIPAGTRINPLKALPFTQQLVVFNASNAEEVDAVAHWLETQDRTLRRITLITTQLDRAQGWNRLNALEKTLDSPVYLLNASLKQRFDLQVTPSFVQAKGLAFEIEEIPAKELVHEKAQ